jgi:hypothetical protein
VPQQLVRKLLSLVFALVSGHPFAAMVVHDMGDLVRDDIQALRVVAGQGASIARLRTCAHPERLLRAL